MAVITIVGAGMMGSAMSFPARHNGHEIRLVGTHLDTALIQHARATGTHLTLKRALPGGISYETIDALEKTLLGADIVIGGVSSFGITWFGENVLPLIPEGVPVLLVTKGLLDMPDGSLKTFPDVLAEQACQAGRHLKICAIGGPCTSYELADLQHSSVMFCGKDPDALLRLKATLETPYYHISLSGDVRGVEYAAALKNAYALGVTLAVGLTEAQNEKRAGNEALPLAYNPQAALFTQSIREMRLFLRLAGGEADALAYGAGDLFVTVFGGRTRLLGSLLGGGLSITDALARLGGLTLESVAIAERVGRSMREMARQGKLSICDFPLMAHVCALLDGGENIPIPWKAFETDDETVVRGQGLEARG